LAFTIGAVVGFVYGLVDAALLRGSAALFRWTLGPDQETAFLSNSSTTV
jgi:hypothetical protein